MSAVLAEPVQASGGADAGTSTAVVLLGTGTVGAAFLRLLDTPAAVTLRLVGIANSRRQTVASKHLVRRALRRNLDRIGNARDDGALLDALDGACCRRVIVDATASQDVATCHAGWLRAGYHVVTANKAAVGGRLADWRAVEEARQVAAIGYGDSATVGAGLPVVATARRLRACGDRVRKIEGVFSGSLSWLFNASHEGRPFSTLLLQARALGYTEPDPRVDLSGLDVARKLLILARNAGYPLRRDDVEVDDLVPPELKSVTLDEFLARAGELDAPMAQRQAEATARGGVLRHMADFTSDGHAAVGLRVVPREHPAAGLHGTDNLFAFRSDCYRASPLLIQGPGAGAEVTAQALLADVLALSGA